MASYIGTPTSRVDGRAKVTGAAKYAAEFNVPGLAHASVVSSTIAKGRIARIDASAALRVSGVIDVLTHENRPPMADADSAYKDDVAPEGSPFRPLYDGRIAFSRQPVALVLAEEWEIARFALGGVAHKPWRDQAAEATLRGQAPNAGNFRRAADALLREAKGFEHNSFKIDLARRAIVRALTQAAHGTPQSQSNKKIR